MSLVALANHMASKGRNGDSVLVHMTPGEVQALQALAERHGGTLTINPETGQPEANFLKKLLPAIAGFALGPAGFGLMSASMAGLTVGGITTLATGSLSRGIMAGLGAYGGAGLGEALTGAGTGAIAAGDIAAQQAAGTFPTLAEGATQAQVADYASKVSALRDTALQKAGEASLGTKLSAGFGQIASNPGAYAKDLLKTGYAAATPIMAADTVKTTTPRGDQTPSYIRPFLVDQYSQEMRALDPIDASQVRMKAAPGMADGGIVALANGGTGAEQYFAANPDVAAAFKENPYGKTAQEFADFHYANYGSQENRASPASLAPAVAARAGIDAFQIGQGQDAAAANYLKNNADVANWISSQEGKDWAAQNQAYDPADIAWTHYVKFGAGEGRDWKAPVVPKPVVTQPTYTGGNMGSAGGAADGWTATTPATYAPTGTTNPYGNGVTPGDLTFNADGSVTVQPNIPGRPYGGFTGIQQLKDAYTAGGGSLGQRNLFVPQTVDEMYERYGTSGGSKQAYDYLMGKGAANVRKPVIPTADLMLPYADAMGLRKPTRFVMPKKRVLKKNADGTVTYVGDGAAGGDAGSAASAGSSGSGDAAGDAAAAAADAAAAAAGDGTGPGTGAGWAYGGRVHRMALGGLGALAGGGSTYNLGGYSDGGRLLRGPGDGVSDSIPATIGDKQPARLADGEFVVPARIVSELGNGSTEAGARKLYAMMDRVQKARGKTTGKGKVAKNTRADKYLPA